MSEKDLLEGLLDEILSSYVDIGQKTGTSLIANNTLKQIYDTRSFYKTQRSEKEKWEGYTEPYYQIDIGKYIDEVKKMNKGETKVFEIHHPYYRKKIREVAEELGYFCKSSGVKPTLVINSQAVSNLSFSVPILWIANGSVTISRIFIFGSREEYTS